MTPISPDLDQKIRQIIRRCGLQAEQMAAEGFEVTEKGPEDYVTNIDAALDIQLSTAFAELFPNDGVITEENKRSRQQFHNHFRRLWCIDPIDGTEDFIHGRGNYSVMVGLLDNYQPCAGWVYAPGRDQMYFGGSNWGLFQATGEHAPVPLAIANRRLSSAPLRMLIGHRDHLRYGAAIASYLPDIEFYFIGSFGLKVLEVVMGRADLYLYLNRRVKLWDTTGPLALAKAAGLACCSLEGEPIRFVPNAIDPDTLAHKQAILIGHHHLIEELRPKLVAAIHSTSKNSDVRVGSDCLY